MIKSLEQIKKIIRKEYDFHSFHNMTISKIDFPDSCLNEFYFWFPKDRNELYYRNIGLAMRRLESLALKTEKVKDLIFHGQIVSINKLLKKVKSHLFEECYKVIMLEREPLNIFYDNIDDSYCISKRFGYIKKGE